MSGRLPGKIFLPLGSQGRTVLEQVIRQLDHFVSRDRIIVATSDDALDDKTAQLCQDIGVSVARGAHEDVLDRYYQVAKVGKLDPIVRVGADSPLIDPDLLQEMFQIYKQGTWDYVSNTLEDSYPEGLNAEIFSFRVLEDAWKNAKLFSEREHVTPYIKKGDFRKYSMVSSVSYREKRWTLDYEEDYRLLQNIYKSLEGKSPYLRMQDVLALLEHHPEWEDYNRNIPRNEGYLKSLNLEEGL